MNSVAQNSSQNIRNRILPPLLLIVVVLQGAFILSFSQYQKQRIAETRQVTRQRVQDLLQAQMNSNIAQMSTVMEAIIRDPVLMNALLAKDRDTLETRAMPLFQRLQSQYHITHFYFHQPNRINFLRLHKSVRGDLIDRKSLKAAETTGQPSAGLEQAITGNLVLRVVYPWRSDYPNRRDSNLFEKPGEGELIGYLELGIEFKDIAEQVHQLLEVDLIIAVQKKFLQSHSLYETNKSNQLKDNWNNFSDFVIMNQTIETIPEAIYQAITSVPTLKNDQFTVSQDSETTQVIFLPLIDIEGRNLGHVVILQDISSLVVSAHQSLIFLFLISILVSLFLFLFFYILLERVEQNLLERTTKLEEAKQQLQESERKFRAIFNQTFQFTALLQPNGIVLEFNQTALQFSGMKAEEVINQPFWKVQWWYNTPTIVRNLQAEINKARNGEFVRDEIEVLSKNGTVVTIDFSLKPVRNEQEKIVLLIAEGREISERKQSEAKLKAALIEKEVLLKEIHHRVKNNLNIISSLIELQSETIENEQYKNFLQDSQNRILTMSLIHDQLYQSDNLSTINLADYIYDLFENLYNSYDASQGEIKTQIDVEPVIVNLETAIPCGILLNELITNSFKYAFPYKTYGTIKINLYTTSFPQKLHLIVSDNGVGLPQNLDWKNSTSLGLKLVNILAQQLRATITLNRQQGTTFHLTFSELQYRKRF